jgi:hypothetical protein
MICPYSYEKTETVLQDTYEYNEEGQTVIHQQKTVESRFFAECREEKCAVYEDGKCLYIQIRTS